MLLDSMLHRTFVWQNGNLAKCTIPVDFVALFQTNMWM